MYSSIILMLGLSVVAEVLRHDPSSKKKSLVAFIDKTGPPLCVIVLAWVFGGGLVSGVLLIIVLLLRWLFSLF